MYCYNMLTYDTDYLVMEAAIHDVMEAFLFMMLVVLQIYVFYLSAVFTICSATW